MKKIIYLPLFLLLAISIFSCEQMKIKEKQLTEIAKVEVELNELRDTVNKIQFDSIGIYALDMANDKRLIKKFYHSDTVNENLARKINRFNGIRKQFKKVSGKGITFGIKVDSCLAQVARLKNDISMGAGDKSKYQEYINLEKKNLNQLEMEFEQINSTTQRNLKEYKEYSPFVKNFIEEIRKID